MDGAKFPVDMLLRWAQPEPTGGAIALATMVRRAATRKRCAVRSALSASAFSAPCGA